ncbi:hypothetical protein [Sinimarinibacterium sp. CAU 1509]|nr:hypothetical protein [Sinimarinibacterium sp. CAU 1509]
MSLIYRETAATTSSVTHMMKLATQLVRADSAKRPSAENHEPLAP